MYDNSKIVGRIIQGMQVRGMNQMQLAEAAELSVVTVSRIKTEAAKVSLETLSKIAQALDLPMSWFFDETDVAVLPQIPYLPVYLGVGGWSLDQSLQVDRIATPDAWLGQVNSSNACWVQVVGDVMSPKIRHDARVLVVSGEELKSDDRVIYRDGDRVFFKRYLDQGERIMLTPEAVGDSQVVMFDKNDAVLSGLLKVLFVANRA